MSSVLWYVVMVFIFGISWIYRDVLITRYKIAMELYRNVTLSILVEYAIFRFRNYITERLETGLLQRQKKTHFDLVYYDGPNKYIVRFPKVRGPTRMSQAISESGDDITEILRQYIGPSHNFHGIPTTPALLGFRQIKIIFKDETGEVFEQDQILKL
jgi:hypothetical protein